MKVRSSLALLVAVWGPLQFPSDFSISIPPPSALQLAGTTAQSLYVDLQCIDALGEIQAVGTGIPISKVTVLTAAHMKCETPQVLVRVENGVREAAIFLRSDETNDLMLLQFQKVKGPFARFRPARKNESVASMGNSLRWLGGEPLVTGKVILIGPRGVISDIAALSGLSGSALVAEDGQVVGMNVRIHGDGLAAPYGLLMLIVGAVPAEAIKAFLKNAVPAPPSK